jgi:hypothetical protein
MISWSEHLQQLISRQLLLASAKQRLFLAAETEVW